MPLFPGPAEGLPRIDLMRLSTFLRENTKSLFSGLIAVLSSLAYPFQLLYVAAISFAFSSHKARKARKRLRF